MNVGRAMCARPALSGQSFRQQAADFAGKSLDETATHAEIAARGYFAALADHIDAIGRSVAGHHLETGSEIFDANISRPVMLMGQYRFAGVKTVPAAQRNFPTRPAHCAFLNT
jgi:hypothetical protein